MAKWEVLSQEEENPMLVGQTLRDRYHIVREIGTGAFGRTYQAEDRYYPGKVLCVVKNLQPQIPAEYKQPEQRAEFLRIAQDLYRREVEELKRIGRYSAQIPTILDYFEEEEQFYFVQEWIDGKPLSELLPIGTKITQEEAIALLIEILEPLVFCLYEQVIHRNLKPDNIMRRNADSWIEPNKLVLIDFGAMKDVSSLIVMNLPVMSRAIREYPSYGTGIMGFMPTEQLNGRPCFASDVYAVGMICVQALTGVSAHMIGADPDTEEVLWRSGTSCDGQAYQCYTTPEFDLVLDQMVKRKPGERYGNVIETLAALRALPVPQVSAPSLILSDLAGDDASGQNPLLSMPEMPIVAPNLQRFSFEVATLQWQKALPPSGMGLELFIGEMQIRKETKQAEFITEDLGPGVQMDLVSIPGGSFMMGVSDGDGGSSEEPQHLVMVPAFYMSKYPVTQDQYMAIMGKNPSRFEGGNLPVEDVSWDDAQKFCANLSRNTGKLYRLPSEAEWEYACRAGTTTTFHFGEGITLDFANFNGKFSYRNLPGGQGFSQTSPVDFYKFPNDFGLYGMHGNLWEWCEDLWHDNYEGAPTDGSAWIENGRNNWRMMRGGSWRSAARDCKVYHRESREIDIQDSMGIQDDVGFRVVYAPTRIL
jgi:eukaryotic-like serine/threonine-protein kinase